MKRNKSMLVTFGLLAGAAAIPALAQVTELANGSKVNADGSLDVAPFKMPFSVYASPEARIDMEEKLARAREMRSPEAIAQVRAAPNPILGQRALVDRVNFAPRLEAQKRRYDVTMTGATMGGVEVQVFEPKGGVSAANSKRVLINLHGGGFVLGWPLVSQIESIPISAVGRIKVVSVNYGKFPEARFPRSSEDVAAVYKELLKTYKPSQIGIYGCSAGGIVTGQALAWFQKQNLPTPGAAAILSGNIDPVFIGDSAYLSPQFGGLIPAPKNNAIDQTTFFAGANPDDPTVMPSRHPDVLAKYPPLLIATGTRASDMSSATRSHIELVKAGADARLVLWDGLDHCFMYNPDMPESREAYDLVTRFFDTQLGRAKR